MSFCCSSPPQGSCPETGCSSLETLGMRHDTESVQWSADLHKSVSSPVLLSVLQYLVLPEVMCAGVCPRSLSSAQCFSVGHCGHLPYRVCSVFGSPDTRTSQNSSLYVQTVPSHEAVVPGLWPPGGQL
jgi:hypothetical protein